MNVLIMTAIYPTPENPAFGSFVRTQAEALRQAGVGVDVLVLRGRLRKLIYLKGLFQLRRRLAARRFDLIHAHYSYVGMVARTQWKVPVVVTYHGDDLLGTINEWGQKTHTSAFIVAAGKKLSQQVDAAIVQTKEMAAKLDESNVYVIPHEIDLELFRPISREQSRATLGISQHKKYLLFAANPRIPVKRFTLAKAVADFLSQNDPTVELVTVHKETQERLALYMSACDVLLCTSYQEGSPNIVKQAMACNLPIVTTDVGDVRQIIGDCAGCYVCAPSVTEFASRVREILSHPMRTAGREQVHHLDCPSVSARVIAVYQRVLQSQRKAGPLPENFLAPTE